jgi:hypothetical protein
MKTRTNEKGLAVQPSLWDFLGSGERIRTSDLRVMSVFSQKQPNYLLSHYLSVIFGNFINSQVPQ